MGLLSTIQNVINPYTPVDNTKVFGCDTSHWSGVLDWNIAKSTGMAFTIGKAMDGVTPTKYFVENYEGAKKVGILTGMYSWLYKSTFLSTALQAKSYADLYKKYPTDLPPTIDFEWSYGGNPNAAVDLYDFLIRFEDLTGKKCMVYTAWGYWQQYGSTNAFYAKYPLWVAQYKVTQPNKFAPWNGDYKLFQFTDRAQGSLYGYQSGGETGADMNYFNGSMEDLYVFCGKIPNLNPEPTPEPIPVDPPTPEPVQNKFTVTVNALNIRAGSSTSNPIIGQYYYNNIVYILEYKRNSTAEVWGKTDKGWICLLLNATYFTSKRDFSDVPSINPTPTPTPDVPSNLYFFSKESFWQRPSGGPCVTPTFSLTKTSSVKEILLESNWVNFMKNSLSNTVKAFGKIVAPDWGPSKGYNNNGLLIFNTLIYPGRNIVQVTNISTGIDGQSWGVVKCLPVKAGTPDSSVNYIDAPHLIHTVYGSGSNSTYFSLDVDAPKVPILENDTPKFVEMKWLTSVDSVLPKTVKVLYTMNIRNLPTTAGTVISSISAGQSVVIKAVAIGKGGIWGKIDTNKWVAIRNNDKNMTDWQL